MLYHKRQRAIVEISSLKQGCAALTHRPDEIFLAISQSNKKGGSVSADPPFYWTVMCSLNYENGCGDTSISDGVDDYQCEDLSLVTDDCQCNDPRYRECNLGLAGKDMGACDTTFARANPHSQTCPKR